MKNSLYLRAEELKNIYISVSADTVILPGTVVWVMDSGCFGWESVLGTSSL